MKRTLALAVALGATVGTSGLALAQTSYYAPYGQPYYAPAYNTAPPAAVYPPPAPAYPYGYYGDGTHSSGGAGRAYPYGGGPKPN